MSVQPTGVPAQASSVSTGLALMALAMLIIPSMDILGKLLSKEINGIQVAQWRFGFQALYILPFLLWLKGASGLLPKRIGLNLLRAVLMAGAVTCFFTALRWMSVPDAIAVFFVEPLILPILSGLILKEQVGWRRRIAVGVGFIGALIVIQPSYAVFGPVSLLPVCTAFLFANYLLQVQQQTDDLTHRKNRAEMIRQLFKGLFERKDSRRIFSPEQRRLLWNSEDKKKCSQCGAPLDWNNFQVDHIKAHSQGGRTRLSNAALICRHCNPSKGAGKRAHRRQAAA